MTKRYCLTLDLKDDPQLIREYERHHEAVWPEVLQSLKEAGITSMEIYRMATRLFMVMETTEEFSFEKKAESDKRNPAVQKWEELMWKYQQPLPETRSGEKWLLMDKIFEIS